MSTATEISRLQAARNTIRNKLITLGLATSTDKLDSLADAIDGISNQGAISASVQEGDTYTIPQGYHNGSGTVSGIAGGGNYQLQAKGPITPTKNQISVSPDNGYYGLSAVTVDAIPEAYQDVSAVTAEASQVLATKIFVTSDGTITTGTMANNGAVSQILTAASTSYTVPSGYHNGSGTVSIVTEEKSATPTTASQNITPTDGKVLSKVTVAAIPSNFKDITNVDAVASNVLSGKTFVNSTGEVSGTMVNNGAISQALSTSITSYTVPSGYHNGSGTVSLTLETKSATPSTSSQNVVPTSGKVLSQVTVEAIPSRYGNTYGDDAIAANILYGKKAHSYRNDINAAYQITGTMPNIGAASSILDTSHTSYTIPSGYHNGSGTVSLVTETKSAIPSTVSQDITPTSGKVLSKVTVAAIQSAYQDVTGVTAVASHVLTGDVFVDASGSEVTGTMSNNSAISGSIDGLTTLSYTIPSGYHNGSGTVSLTSDIETALAAI